MSTRVIFTSRRWTTADGDAAAPTTVCGIEVKAQLRARRDRPGALSQLADDRYALTDELLAVGSRQQLVWFLRARWRATRSTAERAWLEEVRGVLDERAPIPKVVRRARHDTRRWG